jgi:N-acetyl-alpha-D-muramate 1-phosphate uridylyltransferase
MADSLAGVALGAGSGQRLRPLTIDRPKVLCPVDGVPLVDHAVERLRAVTDTVAVNAHDTQERLQDHLAGRVHVSVEAGPRLGTAGALGHLRSWIDGRATAVVNGDTWCPGGIDSLVDGWDGSTIRILVVGDAAFGASSRIAGALMPWRDVSSLDAVPSGLWEVSWRAAHEEGRVETVHHQGPFVDCATPADYLAANLQAAGGSSVGRDAVVEGVIENCVIWDGAVVLPQEHLRHAIRTDTGRTVLVRSSLIDVPT